MVVSYQVQTPALGLVLPSNSPGVHTLWLPVLPLQIGLVLKPGRPGAVDGLSRCSACAEAGISAAAISIYPGGHDVGGAIMATLPAKHDLRRRSHRRKIQGQPARAGAWPRLQQDSLGRRRGRSLGGLLGLDGRKRGGERRPRLHQLLDDLGLAAHGENRRGSGRADRPDRSQAARRSRGSARRVYHSRRGG